MNQSTASPSARNSGAHNATPVMASVFGLIATLTAHHALASEPPPHTLDLIQISGQRLPLTHFPGAINVLDGETLRDGQLQISLAETLQAVPGVIALERHNYAQDLQLQSRGFGARSTFGIRGLLLVTDGIPATALDGQGQASGFALSMLDRIEILRGPLALQYGNAAGGAIIGESVLGDAPSTEAGAWLGRDDSRRWQLRGDLASGAWRARAGVASFATDGHRPQSAAQRDEAHAILRWQPNSQQSLQWVANALRQPQTQDPLGLTPAQWRQSPRSTDPAALTFNTRKRIEQRQTGLRWQSAYAPGREFTLSLWHARREIEQFLAIPPAVQNAPSHAGGVVAPDRQSSGLSISHRQETSNGAWAIGGDLGGLRETRRGYENFIGDQLGVRGRLRRDERNRLDTRAVWFSGETRFADAYSALAAIRHDRFRFQSRDYYIRPGNGDDSGRLDYAETAFAAGLARRYHWGEWFASLGRGHETPTINELAYRPDGSGGLNTALYPARYHSIESGLRWRGSQHDASLALYRIAGDGEIVQVLSSGGRSSFANAARSRRDGVEASLQGAPHPNFDYQLSLNVIDARFRQGWQAMVMRGGQAELRQIAAGNRVPGIPRVAGYAGLDWHRVDRALALRWEISGHAALPVDDGNQLSAPGHIRHALALRWQAAERSGWHGFIRIDNVFDQQVVGSVIVNEANGRSFEPAPGWGFSLGIGWKSGD